MNVYLPPRAGLPYDNEALWWNLSVDGAVNRNGAGAKMKVENLTMFSDLMLIVFKLRESSKAEAPELSYTSIVHESTTSTKSKQC